MSLRKALAYSLMLCATVPACGNDDDAKVTPEGLCARARAIATKLGCSLGSCTIEDHCADAYAPFIACLEQDTSQCMCESDGDLNCEGAFKPDEGPAKCQSQYQPVRACSE